MLLSVNPIVFAQEGKTTWDHVVGNDVREVLQKHLENLAISKLVSKPTPPIPTTSTVTAGVGSLSLGKRKAADTDAGSNGERSWLGVRLKALGVCARWIDHCERALVQEECLSTEEVFRHLSAEEFNTEYLQRVGVTALGLQKHLLALHAELKNE